MIQKWNQNPSKSTSKIDAKKHKKKVSNLKSAEEAVSPNQSFQKTSFGVRCEESTLRKLNEG
jgi:hypothetical protein